MKVHLYHSRKKRHHWLDALSVGLKRHGIEHEHWHEDEYTPSDIAVTIGWRTRTGAEDRNHVINEQWNRGLRQITLELGFFGDRIHNRSIGWGGPAGGPCDYRNRDVPSDRWEKHGVPVKDWRIGGDYILFARQYPVDSSLFDVDDYERSVTAMCDQMSHAFKLPVRVRDHPKVRRSPRTLEEDLEGAWCVATHSSNVAVDAILRGIPAAASPGSIASPVSMSFPSLTQDPRPDRTSWLASLGYAQWTVDEFRSGEVWDHLTR